VAIEGTFVGVDSKPMTYTHFNPNEPNNLGNEDCVETNFAHPAGWNDISCDTALNAFCQKDGNDGLRVSKHILSNQICIKL